MTFIDQVKGYTRMLVQMVTDKEPVSYVEAAALYGIILQAKHNISMLSSFYNQAEDPDLRELIKEAIYEHALPTIEDCEKLMKAGEAEIPQLHFPPHPLYDKVDYPRGVRLSDMEIAVALGTLARSSQLTLFLALEQCYQLEIIAAIYKLLSSGLQWDYRLVQLTIHRGWLPTVAKVKH